MAHKIKEGLNTLLLAQIGNYSIALPVDIVKYVLRAAEVTKIPETSNLFYGVINIYGKIVPVFNIRTRLGLPAKEIEPEDRFVIINLKNREIVLVFDAVNDTITYDHEAIQNIEIIKDYGDAERGNPDLRLARFITENSLTVIVYNPDLLFSEKEIEELNQLDELIKKLQDE